MERGRDYFNTLNFTTKKDFIRHYFIRRRNKFIQGGNEIISEANKIDYSSNMSVFEKVQNIKIENFIEFQKNAVVL